MLVKQQTVFAGLESAEYGSLGRQRACGWTRFGITQLLFGKSVNVAYPLAMGLRFSAAPVWASGQGRLLQTKGRDWQGSCCGSTVKRSDVSGRNPYFHRALIPLCFVVFFFCCLFSHCARAKETKASPLTTQCSVYYCFLCSPRQLLLSPAA